MSQDDTERADLDPVARTILDELAGRPAEATLTPDEAARAFAETRRRPSDGPDLFKRYRRAVKQQALHLARAGEIEIVRKGEAVDPDDFKGLWRMRLKRG